MTEAQKTAERMRRVAAKESQLQVQETNTPDNYLSPTVINAIDSVKGKNNKEIFDKLIARTLIEIIQNGKDNKEKMAAIDRYHKLTQSNQIMVQNGSSKAAIETETGGTTTLNIDLRSHATSDEPIEPENVKTRDLVREKNDTMFGSFEEVEEVEVL